MYQVIWSLVGVLVGAAVCFVAILYATRRFQSQTIRQSNWERRVELYIGIDRYMQDVQTYLIALAEVMDSDRDPSELFRKLRISTRTFFNYIHENRGEIDLYLPQKIAKHVFDVQVLSNMHMASMDEAELYWDHKSIDLVSNYINETIDLIKKDMKAL